MRKFPLGYLNIFYVVFISDMFHIKRISFFFLTTINLSVFLGFTGESDVDNFPIGLAKHWKISSLETENSFLMIINRNFSQCCVCWKIFAYGWDFFFVFFDFFLFYILYPLGIETNFSSKFTIEFQSIAKGFPRINFKTITMPNSIAIICSICCEKIGNLPNYRRNSKLIINWRSKMGLNTLKT